MNEIVRLDGSYRHFTHGILVPDVDGSHRQKSSLHNATDLDIGSVHRVGHRLRGRWAGPDTIAQTRQALLIARRECGEQLAANR